MLLHLHRHRLRRRRRQHRRRRIRRRGRRSRSRGGGQGFSRCRLGRPGLTRLGHLGFLLLSRLLLRQRSRSSARGRRSRLHHAHHRRVRHRRLRHLRRRLGRFALTHPHGLAQQEVQRLRRRRQLERVLVRVHAVRETHPPAADAVLGETRRQLLGRLVARRVAVVRDQHPLDTVGQERFVVLARETVRAVRRGHVAEARAPKRQRVDQRLAHDHLLAGREGGEVPDARVRAGQVQVLRRALPQRSVDLPAVRLHHLAIEIEDRDDERAVQVLVAALADDPQLLEAFADLLPCLAARLRQAQTERAVGKAQLESPNRLVVGDSALLEVRERLWALEQGLVVVVDHLPQQIAIARVEPHRRRQVTAA